MRITILGATGGIGGHLLTWALEAGHEVNVLARHPEALNLGALVPEALVPGAAARGPAAPGVTVTRGDALDPAAVTEAAGGADAVLSALGPRGARAPGLLAGAAANTVAAMRNTGARRLICVSAAGAFITGDPHTNWLVKQILPRVLAKPFADVRRMEDVIAESGLDWTLVRATRLVNTALTGRYRVAPGYPPRGGGKISRADVAHFMAAVLSEDAWVRSAPVLAY
jgi:uncharacterized protein YbjT (DUF2867 family)